ncbi:hypothetical protein GIB67_000474 [Kingdonia uniflora]|uniref:Uncharacterized protein n=1 Tax=Kingdonia uniflora TaxID=39325 RepID=A0A7J7L0B9_9MAGN|nr:hypothetical protein GIB67_000474 [Kingdonia uniflora]
MGGDQQQSSSEDRCEICYLLEHQASCCPWLYTKCKSAGCEGIMKLMTSFSPKNFNIKYLKCQYRKYNTFKWLSEAVIKEQRKATTSSPGSSRYFGCGLLSHWVKDCPWKDSVCVCAVDGCIGVRKLETSRQPQSYGIFYSNAIPVTNLGG